MTNWQVKGVTPEAWAKTQKPVDRRAAVLTSEIIEL